eukprot:9364191-Alexandrium_andersonii.AAC.1
MRGAAAPQPEGARQQCERAVAARAARSTRSSQRPRTTEVQRAHARTPARTRPRWADSPLMPATSRAMWGCDAAPSGACG